PLEDVVMSTPEAADADELERAPIRGEYHRPGGGAEQEQSYTEQEERGETPHVTVHPRPRFVPPAATRASGSPAAPGLVLGKSRQGGPAKQVWLQRRSRPTPWEQPA